MQSALIMCSFIKKGNYLLLIPWNLEVLLEIRVFNS